MVWCLGAREKRFNTGEPVLDVPTVLLHQQREMQLLRKQMENVTGLLQHQTELMQRMAVSVPAKMRLQLHVWQPGNRNLGKSFRKSYCNGGS